MTEGESGDDGDFPDGSVGRYVREQWGAAPVPRKTRPYVAPVREPEPEAPAGDASLPLRPAEPVDGPGMHRLDEPGVQDDVAAWAERGRAATARPADASAGPAAAPAALDPARRDSGGRDSGGWDSDGWDSARRDSDGRDPDGRDPGPGYGPAPVPPRSAAPPPPVAGPPLPSGAPPFPPSAGPPPAGVAPPHDSAAHPVVAASSAAAHPVAAGQGTPPEAASQAGPVGAPGSGPPTGSPAPARPPGPARPGVQSRPAGDGVPAVPAPRTPPRGVPRWTDPGAVAAQQAQHARNPDQPDLSSARLLRPSKRPPQSGWRRLVYVLSGRLINPGESPADVHRRELTVRVNQPLLGCYKIGVLSLKGGVGKTTMTATLGATFASLRGDRVVAVDANPDRGTLSQKIPLETSATVRNLLRDAQRVRRYTDVRAYTSQGPSRLEVLASEQDPAVSEAFSEDDYRRTVNLLEHFYNIVLTDCGTGLMHSAMYGVLGVADQLIIVSSSSIDGARSASATMDWLDAHGHDDLVRNAVAVVNCVSRSSGGVDLDRVAEHFAARCRAVVRIPFDAHLQEGAEVDLDRLEPQTRLALLELAAAVADAFASAHSGG